MPRLLEEVRGQRNPSEEKKINELAEKKRKDAEAKARTESWNKMISYLPDSYK